MAFKRHQRQAIIDGYLAATGRNMFVASEFIDWLADQPEHEAYDLFFGMDDEAAARQYRIDLARRMASGLRIVAQVSTAPDSAQVLHISTREYPAYVSPMAGRKAGGGYEPFDPSNAEAMVELQAQGAQALRAWLSRYRGAAETAGVNLAPIENIVAILSRDVALAG